MTDREDGGRAQGNTTVGAAYIHCTPGMMGGSEISGCAPWILFQALRDSHNPIIARTSYP